MPGSTDAVVRGCLSDGGVVQQLGQLTDPGLHLALLLLGGVIAAVLLDVAFVAGGLDLLGDLGATLAGELGQLALEPVIGLLGQVARGRRRSVGHVVLLGCGGLATVRQNQRYAVSQTSGSGPSI